jgi:hypothetical protein
MQPPAELLLYSSRIYKKVVQTPYDGSITPNAFSYKLPTKMSSHEYGTYIATPSTATIIIVGSPTFYLGDSVSVKIAVNGGHSSGTIYLQCRL